LTLGGHTVQYTVAAFNPDGRRLASATGKGYSVLVWDMTGLNGGRPFPQVSLSSRDLENHWAALAGADAPQSDRAVWDLALAPQQAVPFLGGRVRPAEVVADPGIERFIADLDHDRFAVRERATEELARRGTAAGPALRKALAKPHSLEVGLRV